ncbi:MAG: hypothetical protein ACPHRO_02075 [Nannocystaceae bacterium]
MTVRRSKFRSLTLHSALFSIVTLAATAGCPSGDVGAPCNHGEAVPPPTKLVTFPAVSCDDLICVYGEDDSAPAGSCNTDLDCNNDGGQRFECLDNKCSLSFDYFLERSMCSKRCESNADCKNSGITTAKKPLSETTRCESGFECAVVQNLGQFCCEKLCVCSDDIAPDQVEKLETECEPTFASGRSTACGCDIGDCGQNEYCDLTQRECFPCTAAADGPNCQ